MYKMWKTGGGACVQSHTYQQPAVEAMVFDAVYHSPAGPNNQSFKQSKNSSKQLKESVFAQYPQSLLLQLLILN